jgi:type I restriction enzyme S subunit
MSFKSIMKYRLGDICEKIGSGATPRGGKESYFSDGEYSLIRSQNVLDYFFSYDGLAFINEIQAKKLNNVTLAEDDVLLNITGDSVARVCQVPKEVLPARVNQHVAIIRPNRKILDNCYLKYYLLNPIIKNHLLNISKVGATRKAITKVMIEDLEIEVPELIIQKKIAKILSDIDSKIELNKKNNITLENVAKTLYRTSLKTNYFSSNQFS